MYYKQFQNTMYSAITESAVKDQAFCYGVRIVETVSGDVLINGEYTSYESLEEAVSGIKQQKVQEELQHQIQAEIYEGLSDNKVAQIIREHHSDVKVTDTLIESYVELASSKIFTLDPIAHEIRKINNLDQVVEGKIEFNLEDGSAILIDESTYHKINNLFGQHDDVVGYMRKTADNFLSIVDQIGDN